MNNIFFKKAKAINTDSRSLQEGQIFLALKGKNHDGHDHIYKALELGASMVISEKEFPDIDNDKISVVENTLETYHQIANSYLRAVNPLVIGITGSSGKTTTKELLVKILEKKFKVHATEKNFNNEYGVPKTILEMPEETQVLILEMAMRGLGEISLLSKTGRPNIAIITNIGTAHIERLGSKENIRKAKLEIIDGIENYQGWMESPACLIVDEDNFSHISTKLNISDKLPSLVKTFNSNKNFELNVPESPGLIADCNAAAEAAYLLGMTRNEIQERLLKYQHTEGRGNIVEDELGNIFINDSYNANPESVRNSIEALIKNYKNIHKIAVIGEIAESLPDLVEKLFSELKSNEEITLIDARNKNLEEVKSEIKKNLKGKTAILIKASRVAGLERILA